jgi:hypothetical protein
MSQIRELRIELALLERTRRNIYNLKRIAVGINPFCDLVLLGLGEAGNKNLLYMDGLVSGS